MGLNTDRCIACLVYNEILKYEYTAHYIKVYRDVTEVKKQTGWYTQQFYSMKALSEDLGSWLVSEGVQAYVHGIHEVTRGTGDLNVPHVLHVGNFAILSIIL